MRIVGIIELAFALPLLCSCGQSELWRQSDFAHASEFPFVVKVRDPVGDLNCSGTMLSDRTLLTAAHCVRREGRFVVVAAMGVTSAYEVGRLGDGAPEDTGDLVLLKTDDPVAAPVYPRIGTALQEGERIRLAGFGCRDFDAARGGGSQQVGWNRVYHVSDFAYLLTPIALSRTLVGENGEQAGLCYGDSGSPAFRESDGPVLIGVGHGAGRTEENHVSLLVDVTKDAPRRFLAESAERLGVTLAFDP